MCQKFDMYPKLVVFDIDGTLLPDTTIARHMAAHLGSVALINELEDAWDSHKVGHREFAVQSAAAYSGHNLKSLEDAAMTLPIIDGAEQVVRILRKSGCSVILSTMSMAFAARVLARKLGCHDARGTELEMTGEMFTGKVSAFNHETDKAVYASHYREKLGIQKQDIAAIGDSRADIPLFAEVGRAIALNASPAAVEAADRSIRTRDLTDILPLLEV
jgi:phosphoserine phosphatase